MLLGKQTTLRSDSTPGRCMPLESHQITRRQTAEVANMAAAVGALARRGIEAQGVPLEKWSHKRTLRGESSAGLTSALAKAAASMQRRLLDRIRPQRR